jgi:predicted Zn finger-like uncharacterized protein
MIITCASCLTRFNLDDSRISAKGAKVRCSRCKHVFYIVPPPETKEEIIEDLESFSKYHEEMMGPGQKEEEKIPPLPKVEKKEVTPEEEEETYLFSEKGLAQEVEQVVPVKTVKEEMAERKTLKPKRMVRAERRGPSLFFAIIVVSILLVFGIFYLWTELGSGAMLSSYLEYPIKKITHLWDQIWGTEKEGLIVGDLNGYEEKVEDIPLFIIEGKVTNQSRLTKKYIKIRVVIFDQDKAKLAEKETVCGRIISRGEVRNLPPDFFKGDMMIQPRTEREMIIPSNQAAPFMMILKEDLSNRAKEFKIEIVEAPNL